MIHSRASRPEIRVQASAWRILRAAFCILHSAVCLLGLPGIVSAQPQTMPLDLAKIDPQTFHAMATRLPKGQAPKIDGKLDDAVWDLAPPQGNFVQREPYAGTPISERTEFRVLYDDHKIYFALWAFDSDPKGIRASEYKRDSGLAKGDQMRIVIDTFHDRRNGFYFATNPLGAKKDAQYTDNARVTNNDWNAVWECRTTVDGHGWYAEIAIPLSQLRFKTAIGDTTWGLNVGRRIVRKNEESYWVAYPRAQGAYGFARLSNAGVLDGLRDIRSRRRLEIVPFVAPQAGRDYTTDSSTNDFDRYGVDARVGITDTLTADLTYKTDFAQVEADQEVVNVSRFSLFFPEKRQFFTETAGLFNYGKSGTENGDQGPGLLPLFYSRRIGLTDDGREVPLLAGGRVTGRAGGYSVGVMNIETDRLDSGSGATAVHLPRANYTVLRAKRNVFGYSSVGAIVLNRQGNAGTGTDYNRTVGFDLNLVLGKTTTLTTLAARSFTPGATGNQFAGGFDLAYQKDRYNYGVTYLDVGDTFNAEMGYIRRTDIRNPKVRAAWTPRPTWKGVRQLTIGAQVDSYWNHQGTLESRTTDAQFASAFNDTSTLTVDVAHDQDRLSAPWRLGNGIVPAGRYDWDTFSASYLSNSSLRVAGSAGIQAGNYYSGNKTTVSAGLSLLPTNRLLLETSFNRNQISLPTVPVYVTNTVSTRVSYSFSPSLFTKAFIQFNDAKKQATFNCLFWYIYRPGSDFYVVYNEGWDTTIPGVRDAQPRNRSLSVKITYWLSR
jgi:hypothetical protein